MQVAQPMTAEEFLALETSQRGLQLIDGAIVMNEPGLLHQVLQVRLITAFNGWIRAGKGRGLIVTPLDVLLDDRNVYAPDVLWYGAARAPALDDRPPYPVPDLAIEIRSPSTWRYDIGAKKRTYEQKDLPELWLVDGDAGVLLVYRRSAPRAPSFDIALELDRGATLTSPLLPGFAVDVGELFARD